MAAAKEMSLAGAAQRAVTSMTKLSFGAAPGVLNRVKKMTSSTKNLRPPDRQPVLLLRFAGQNRTGNLPCVGARLQKMIPLPVTLLHAPVMNLLPVGAR